MRPIGISQQAHFYACTLAGFASGITECVPNMKSQVQNSSLFHSSNFVRKVPVFSIRATKPALYDERCDYGYSFLLHPLREKCTSLHLPLAWFQGASDPIERR